MSIQLEAVIEHWPADSRLYVLSLPGFVVRGADSRALQAAVSDALKSHLAWLVRHELIEDPAGEIDLSVKEQMNAESATIGPRFAADLPAPSDAEIETALAVGRAAISDLIDYFDATAGSDDVELTVTAVQIAQQDDWYASRLGAAQLTTLATDPLDTLVKAAGRFEDEVDAYVSSGLPELWRTDGEEWTLAKLLRRRTAHLREHLPERSAKPAEDDDHDDMFDDE